MVGTTLFLLALMLAGPAAGAPYSETVMGREARFKRERRHSGVPRRPLHTMR